jgi:hypothetical protein
MTEKREQLKDWIGDNMTTETIDDLDKWKEKAAGLVSVSPTGNILPKVDTASLDAPDQILLQLLGRAYAEAGGFVNSATMSNSLLKEAVPAPPGTIDRALLDLRRDRLVESPARGENRLIPSRIGETVTRISGKLGR